MKVKDLVKRLQELPPELEVTIFDSEWGDFVVSGVELESAWNGRVEVLDDHVAIQTTEAYEQRKHGRRPR